MEYIAHEVAKIMGITVQTLHYYEEEGLIHNIKRDLQNRRIYSEGDIEWIRMVVLMRKIDIPIKEIRNYSQLLIKGPSTVKERLNIIQNYKKVVIEKLSKMENALKWLNIKEDFYIDTIDENVIYSTFQDESKAFKEKIYLENK